MNSQINRKPVPSDFGLTEEQYRRCGDMRWPLRFGLAVTALVGLIQSSVIVYAVLSSSSDLSMSEYAGAVAVAVFGGILVGIFPGAITFHAAEHFRRAYLVDGDLRRRFVAYKTAHSEWRKENTPRRERQTSTKAEELSPASVHLDEEDRVAYSEKIEETVRSREAERVTQTVESTGTATHRPPDSTPVSSQEDVPESLVEEDFPEEPATYADEGYWRDLKGRELEMEVGQLYADLGYDVRVTYPAADDGVDVLLTTPTGTIVVQCKGGWSAMGQPVVTQLLGAMMDHHAGEAILISTGGFTAPAKAFANRNTAITLIEVEELAELGRKAEERLALNDGRKGTLEEDDSPRCMEPDCRSAMRVQWSTPKGQHWVCNRPGCLGTRWLGK